MKINGRDLIMKIFPNQKIPKRRSEKKKLEVIKRKYQSLGMSLIHEEVCKAVPKDSGLWCRVLPFAPRSFQGDGKDLKTRLGKWIREQKETQSIARKIGDKNIEILILYFLSSNKKRDIDNFTKNVIDGLKLGGLFKDDSQIKFRADKIRYLKTNGKKYYRSIEKAIVRIDFFNNKNKVIKPFNKIFMEEK